MVTKIAIIGAGVIGLSCAVKIAEYSKELDIDVCLLSEEFSPNTTGDGSAGLWTPYIIGVTAPDKIIKWSAESHQFFHELWKNGLAAEAGICLQPVTRLTTSPDDFDPYWSRIVFGCLHLTYEQLDRYSAEHSRKYTGGVNYITFSCEPTYFLPYLMRRFKSAGGKIFKKRVDNFDEIFKDYDLIINCTGMGARTLASDEKVKPVRGQVTRVTAQWNFQTIMDASNGNYIITNMETVILGGTGQEHDFNQKVSEDDSKFIWNGCLSLIPSLKNSILMKEWVGLRPGRDIVRIEEEIFMRNNGKTGKIIHNYGHGGSGVTLAWGCATEVLDLVKDNLQNSNSNLKCKI